MFDWKAHHELEGLAMAINSFFNSKEFKELFSEDSKDLDKIKIYVSESSSSSRLEYNVIVKEELMGPKGKDEAHLYEGKAILKPGKSLQRGIKNKQGLLRKDIIRLSISHSYKNQKKIIEQIGSKLENYLNNYFKDKTCELGEEITKKGGRSLELKVIYRS